MKILLRSVVVIILINIASYAQHSAPVVWERYRISDEDVSFLFPKMPVRQDEVNICNELRSSSFYVYAEGVVYEFGVYEKLPKDSGYTCYGTSKPFGEGTLRKRLDEIARSSVEVLGSKTKIDGRDANRSATAEWTRLVISDVDKGKRWIELAVHHYAGDTPDFDRFLKSIEFSSKTGKEVGAGFDPSQANPTPQVPIPIQAAGISPTKPASGQGNGPDKFSDLNSGPVPATNNQVKSDRYRTISQPKARYTDAARSANIEGPVRLKITLLANGSIGSVVVAKELSHGLTENAVAAAKRIVFLPKRVNGIPISVVVTFEYTFSIY